MKRLEELGISPAPWRADLSIDDVAWIEDRRLNDIVRLDKYERKNARLIAAAPEMYAKAWELITAFDNRVMSPKHIEALRKALAEAAGEEAAK